MASRRSKSCLKSDFDSNGRTRGHERGGGSGGRVGHGEQATAAFHGTNSELAHMAAMLLPLPSDTVEMTSHSKAPRSCGRGRLADFAPHKSRGRSESRKSRTDSRGVVIDRQPRAWSRSRVCWDRRRKTWKCVMTGRSCFRTVGEFSTSMLRRVIRSFFVCAMQLSFFCRAHLPFSEKGLEVGKMGQMGVAMSVTVR